MKHHSKIAQELGRRGGLKRAQNLSVERRKEIAQMGAKARGESLLLAKRFSSNFRFVNMIRTLKSTPRIVSNSSVRDKLPGIYEKDS